MTYNEIKEKYVLVLSNYEFIGDLFLKEYKDDVFQFTKDILKAKHFDSIQDAFLYEKDFPLGAIVLPCKASSFIKGINN